MNHLILVLPLLTLAILAGCSTVRPDAYNAADEPMHLLNQETNGIRFSVDAVLDRSRSHKYFGTDTLRGGIVPVFVRVENVSNVGSVLVEKEHFRIAINDDSQGQSPMREEVPHDLSAGTGAVLGAGVLLLSTPMIIVSSAAVSTADEVRHNFVDKEFRNQSLAPGRSAQGFVYCQLPDRRGRVSVVSISLPVRNLQTDQQTVCNFLVHHEN